MKFLALAVTVSLAALVAAAPLTRSQIEDLRLVNDPRRIQELNSRPGQTWTAGVNPRFEGMTVGQAKALLGVKFDSAAKVNCTHTPALDYNEAAAPASFDCRTQWPKFIHPIRDQGQCGSCWAFAAAESFSDRLAIATNGSTNEVLAPQELVSCDDKGEDQGCDGGYPGDAFDYLQHTGLPTEACYKYASGDGDTGTCKKTCHDGSAKKMEKLKSWKYVVGEDAMIAAVQDGPVAVAFAVYNDFFNYVSGVYKADKTSGLAGYHAVKMLGYGEEKSTKYWTVANSWATSWGNKGYFNIVRGVNECGMENGPLDKGCPIAGTA